MKWIRDEVLSGKFFGGAWLSLGSAITAEIAGRAGFDWLLLDMEHGCGDYGDLMHQIQALDTSASGTIVRVPIAEASVFKRVLDMGPAGLMIPNVVNQQMARHVVEIARVSPKGSRGLAQTTRASGYGSAYEDYKDSVNEGLLLIGQIESREAIDNIDEIAAVEGIDVLFVGPLDLSIDLETDHDSTQFLEAIARVAAAAQNHGKAAGVLVRNSKQANDYRALGYSFIAMGSDRGLVISGMKRNSEFFASLSAPLAA